MRDKLGKFIKGHKINVGRKCKKETKKKISEKHKGKKFSEEHIEKLSISHLGQKAWNKGKKGVQVSCWKNKKRPEISGEKSNLWKGGICPENLKIRKGVEYQLWREAVFARDKWTCVVCRKRGGRLQAHHILLFSKYPEYRFSLNNGITLCRSCHMKEHTNKKKKKWL